METQTRNIQKTWRFLCYDENLLDWAPTFSYQVTKTVGTRPCIQGVPVKDTHYVSFQINLPMLASISNFSPSTVGVHKYLVDILDKTYKCPIEWEQSGSRITGTLPPTDFAMYDDHSRSALEHEEQTLLNIHQWVGEIYSQVIKRMRKGEK